MEKEGERLVLGKGREYWYNGLLSARLCLCGKGDL